ncbi:MAG: putative DNA binding domain-containing protein [Erysipelotrichaceae bacterium]|nr:putative DNA binding domain-containing protein [Erysipelotrichaceae bacterium]
MKDFSFLLAHKANHESETVEWKHANADPDQIGKYISALSNMAAIRGEEQGYLIFGVNDEGKPVGTDIDFNHMKVGGVLFPFHINQTISPKGIVSIEEGFAQNQRVVVFAVRSASNSPTTYLGKTYGRIGSSLVDLSAYPEIARSLWAKLLGVGKEDSVALADVPQSDVGHYLDMAFYYRKLGLAFPSQDEAISRMAEEGFLRMRDDGNVDITNLGALCLAENMSNFPSLQGNAIEIVPYTSDSRAGTSIPALIYKQGILISFEDIIAKTMEFTGAQETIEGAYRVSKEPLPNILVREMVANAILHQELGIGGAHILIECFPSRLEVYNPGSLAIPADRIVDLAPKPNMKRLAETLARWRIGEGHGTGFDKIIQADEDYFLPPPQIKEESYGVRVIAYKEKPFSQYTSEERIRAVYFHTVLRYINGEKTNNESIRARFRLDEKGKYVVSRLIKAAIEEGKIKEATANAGPRAVSYVPYWA